ncbi:hypothetical protein F350042L8_22300 [Fusobacterium ulcerans]
MEMKYKKITNRKFLDKHKLIAKGEGRELIRGDRGYLSVYKTALKFENGEINETYIPSSS